MTINLTKHGYQGKVKGCINGISFCFYARGDAYRSVYQQLIHQVAKFCAYAKLAA